MIQRLAEVGASQPKIQAERQDPITQARTAIFDKRAVANRWVVGETGDVQRLAVLGQQLAEALATVDRPIREARTKAFLDRFYAERYTITTNNGLAPLFRLGQNAEGVNAQRADSIREHRTETFDQRWEFRQETTEGHKRYEASRKYVVTENETVRRLINLGEDREVVQGDLTARFLQKEKDLQPTYAQKVVRLKQDPPADPVAEMAFQETQPHKQDEKQEAAWRDETKLSDVAVDLAKKFASPLPPHVVLPDPEPAAPVTGQDTAALPESQNVNPIRDLAATPKKAS